MKRKILSILLVVLMMFALFIPSVAQTTVTIIDGNVNATYEAYRLLELTTIELQNNPGNYTHAYTVNETYREVLTKVIGELIGNSLFPDGYTLQSEYNIDPIIDYIYSIEPNPSEVREFADAVYKEIAVILKTPGGFHRPPPKGQDDDNTSPSIELEPVYDYEIIDQPRSDNEIEGILEHGYWLIVETTHDIEEHTARSLVLLDTAGIPEARIEAKVEVPTVQKYVYDIFDHDIQEWTKVASYDKDSLIQFLLVGTIPENINSYDKYFYEFVDTFDKFEYTYGSVQVYLDLDGIFNLNDFIISSSGVVDTYLSHKLNPNDYVVNDYPTLTITFENLMDILPIGYQLTPNSKIYVYYTAKLNEQAEMGEPGNYNTVTLTYSNDIYDPVSTGTTPENIVKVYSYGIDIEKVDESGVFLDGAEFILYMGTEYDITSYLTTNGWVPNGSSGTTYTLKDIEDAPDILSKLADGNVEFEYLYAREDYYIYEIKAPDGYNRLKVPTRVSITPIYDDNDGDGMLDILIDLIEGDKLSGLVLREIQNKPGILLPTTGGIGTTILYIGGTVLLLGSVFGVAIYFMINSRRRSVRRK